MGAALYIVVENKPEDMDVFVNGKALPEAGERLTAAATQAGVKELMSFFSASPEQAAEFMDGYASGMPPEQWFEPADGLATVRALLVHCTASALEADAGVARDLREFETVLERVKQAGLRWHLSVDF